MVFYNQMKGLVPELQQLPYQKAFQIASERWEGMNCEAKSQYMVVIAQQKLAEVSTQFTQSQSTSQQFLSGTSPSYVAQPQHNLSTIKTAPDEKKFVNPKSNKSAYSFYLSSQAKNTNLSHYEFMKTWKSLSETERQPFIKMASEYKAKSQIKLANSLQLKAGSDASLGQSQKDLSKTNKNEVNVFSRGTNKTNPNIPKKVCSPYTFFVKTKVTEVKAQLSSEPNCQTQKSEIGQSVVKALAALWKKMSDQDKQPYVEMEKQDKVRRERQLREAETQGFFILEDGTKSNEQKLSRKQKSGRS